MPVLNRMKSWMILEAREFPKPFAFKVWQKSNNIRHSHVDVCGTCTASWLLISMVWNLKSQWRWRNYLRIIRYPALALFKSFLPVTKRYFLRWKIWIKNFSTSRLSIHGENYGEADSHYRRRAAQRLNNDRFQFKKSPELKNQRIENRINHPSKQILRFLMKFICQL